MNRRHDLDALRAIAFSLLIVFHVGMLYVDGWDWHLKSSYTTKALDLPMIFLNRWRMDLIFLISGAATFFMMRKSSLAAFVRQRTWRLFLPFAFAMLVVIPVQPYCQGVANGLVEPGFGRFLVHYLTGYKWPANAFDGWQYGFTWNHLWYLPYLLAYTLVLAALRPAFSSRAGRALRARFLGQRGWRLLAWPAIPLFVFAFTLGTRFPATHALVDDWYNHATYFTVFLYGWWLASDEDVWRELLRMRKISLLAALLVFIAYWLTRSDHPSTPILATVLLLRSLFVWLMLATILGWGHALLNRPLRWLPFATEAVYPWYILHQSLIVAIAYWLVPMKLGAVAEPALVLAGTIGGCWVLSVGVIGRFVWLRACFGMKPLRPESDGRTVAPPTSVGIQGG